MITAALHVAATWILLFLLYTMAHQGGDSKPSSPEIDAVDYALQALAVPVAWPVERLLNSLDRFRPPFPMILLLRLINSIAVGAGVAWLWVRGTGKKRQTP